MLLSEAASRYPGKNIYAFFNDIDADKIEHLKTLVHSEAGNYHISFHNEDCNQLIRELWQKISGCKDTHYLLVYDPYDAAIDWEAVMPFLNGWGEVIINHMISDLIRAVGSVKRPEAVNKYESTYQRALVELIGWGSDRKKYEECIEDIIRSLRELSGKKYYIASFPFFNRINALVYDLILCTGNDEGFKLFKKTAWQVFGGSSSNKNTHGQDRQGTFDFFPKDFADEYCYNVDDIAYYLQSKFAGRINIPLLEVRDTLDNHPVFPSDSFMNEIKSVLRQKYGAVISQSTITFSSRRFSHEEG